MTFIEKLNTIKENEDSVFNLETKIQIAGKKMITVSVTISKLFDDDDKYIGAVIVFNDITKQKRAELSLNNQINFSKQIFKTIPEVILITDTDLRVIFANKKAENILTKNTDENRKIFNYLSNKSIENGFDEYLRQIIVRGISDKQINVQNPFIDEDGFVDIEIVPLKSESKIIGGLLLVRDITEWRNLTEDLKNLENFNRKMINSSPYVIISVNEKDIVSGWNDRGEAVLGVASESIIGKNLFKMCSPLEIIRDEINEAKIIGEPIFLSDRKIELANGEIIYTEIILYPVYSKEKNVVINIKDISTLKKLENSLVQAQQMGSLGLLTSKIVHDLNNVLNGITGYTTLLEKKVSTDSNIRKYVDRLSVSSLRAIEIIKQTLSFSNTKNDAVIEINEIIKETVKLIELRMGKSQLFLALTQEKLNILGNRTKFSQVIMNLLVNAKDAITTIEEPEIIIKTSLISSDEKNKKIMVNVIDNGIGIKENNIKKIFDTYFTTKGHEKGTGLGLSNVKDIVSQFGGTITVNSNYGHGTEFTLTFPEFENTFEIEKKDTEDTKDLKINGKILLVDDEDTVREIASELLESIGIQCITAVDGEDGILKFEENKDDIELIILDVEMPKKQGNEVFEIIRKSKPDMKILIASGYSKDYLEKNIFDRRIQEYIAKPFQLNELSAKLKEMTT
jgi:PAS domain S-box-containing protein